MIDQQSTPSGDAKEDTQAKLRDYLQCQIADHIKDAITARQSSGIEDVWLEDEDQYEGIDAASPDAPSMITSKAQPRSAAPARSNRSRVFLNITKPKTDTWVSRVQEMLIPHDDRPWEIGPTPVAEIDEAAQNEDQTTVQLSDGTQATAGDVAKALQEKVRLASEKMSTQIEDWLVECSAYAEMRKVIRDAGRVGSGVLKGPFPVARKQRKWVATAEGGMAALIQEKVCPASKRISYWNFLPDPSCGGNHQNGAFVVERDYWTPKVLRDWAGTPGVDRVALAEVLRAGPGKVARQDDRQGRRRIGQSDVLDCTTFEVFHYYGEMSPLEMVAAGWATLKAEKPAGDDDADEPPEPTEDDQEPAGPNDEGSGGAQFDNVQAMELAEAELALSAIPVVATMINDRLVRVVMNPAEDGEFPFDVMVAEEIEDQVWGRGIPRKMATPQRMLNAEVRALMENAGLSAGPIILCAQGVMVSSNGNQSIQGRSLWTVTLNDTLDDVRKAVTAIQIPSTQQQLQAIIEFTLRMADECTNMPLMLQGIVGDAPDTYGGMKMLQGNAASPLKSTAKLFDDRIVVPHLRRYYAWGMGDENVPQEAKGDLQCKARGSTALVQREDGAMFLQASQPLVENPAYRISPAKWFEELCKAHRVSPSSIQYSDEEWKAIQEQQAQNPPPPDPRIASAEINARAKQEQTMATVELKKAQMAHEANEAAFDRQMQFIITEMEREIQAMEFAGEREISLADIKAMLTAKAMDIRNDRDLFSAERQFAVTEGDGRGL